MRQIKSLGGFVFSLNEGVLHRFEFHLRIIQAKF
jgi:hypothetical protein